MTALVTLLNENTKKHSKYKIYPTAKYKGIKQAKHNYVQLTLNLFKLTNLSRNIPVCPITHNISS